MTMNSWDIFLDEKILEISKKKNVLDSGGGSGFQKGLGKYKHLFSGNYKSFDIPGMGADIEGDIHEMSTASESVDGIICNAVLEHVVDPIRATNEMHRILQKGGAALIQVPSIYPYHGNKGYGGKPGYGDYWRFFDDSLEYMFRDFSKVEIVKMGGYFHALVAFFPIQSLRKFGLDRFAIILDKVLRRDKGSTTSGYIVFAVK